MALEVATTIDGLVVTNPNQNDAVGAGDDHLRLLKTCILGSFPNIQKFGFAQKQDTALVITALQNSNRFVVSTSATVSVAFTLPASASITAGWSVGFLTLAGANAVIAAAGTNSINGAAAFSVPPECLGLITYYGNGAFVGSQIPSGIGAGFQFSGNVSVSGAVFVGTTLTVSGNATFKTGVSISGAMSVGAALSVSAATTLGGSLTVSGAAVFGGGVTLAGNITVSGASVFGGPATFNNTVTISAACTVKGLFSVSAASTLGGTLSVSGATVLSSTLNLRGAATFDQTLSVSGAVALGPLTVNGATTLSGDATMKGNVSVSGAFIIGGGLTVNNTTTISADCIIKGNVSISGAFAIGGAFTLGSGQIVFPATQNASAGANTLDDYEEGTWTPVFTFSTPGDVAVTVVTQVGHYTKVGNTVNLWCQFAASVITHTTSAGAMQITGLPFNVAITTACPCLGGVFDNISMTDFSGLYFQPITGGSLMNLSVSNLNGGASAALTTGAHVSGTGLSATGHICYRV